MRANEIAAGSHDEEVNLIDVSRVLGKYWMTVVLAAVLGAAIALVLALVAVPLFRAETIVTDVRDTGMGLGGSVSNQLGGLAALAGMSLGSPTDASREYRAVLASRHLIEEFIRRNRLVPELFPGAEKKPTLWKAVRRFQNDVLTIRQDTRSGITTVSVSWRDPATAAKWANGVVSLANEIIRERALAESTRNVAYLKEQISRTNVIELQRVMYNLIESETKTLMLANARSEYAFRVVDPAVAPEMRYSPRRTVMVLLGGLLGGLVGVCIALARHWRRLSKSYPTQTA